MKRLLAFVTATLMLALCLCAPVSAGCYADEVTKTVTLWNADEAVGRFELDTENQIEGTGCISADFSKNSAVDAKFAVPEVDATGMNAIEFDLYVSDLAIWDWLLNSRVIVYISSAGDSELLNTQYKQCMRNDLFGGKNGSPKVGWNHIVVLFEDLFDPALDRNPEDWGSVTYTPVDMSRINYMRLLFGSKEKPDPSWILKLDNFVFTDRTAGGHTGEWQSDERCHKTKCTVCDKIVSEAHTFGIWQYDEEKHWKNCADCAYLRSEAHSFSEWITVKEPTITEKGVQALNCHGCSYAKTRVIPKTGSQTTDTGCTGVISGAWGVVTTLCLAVLAIRKKQK
jgi:hypothetical protein